jgi:hypothetical protein
MKIVYIKAGTWLVISTSTQQESAINAIRIDAVSNNIDTRTRNVKDPMEFAWSLQSVRSAGKIDNDTNMSVTAGERERPMLALERPPRRVWSSQMIRRALATELKRLYANATHRTNASNPDQHSKIANNDLAQHTIWRSKL